MTNSTVVGRIDIMYQDVFVGCANVIELYEGYKSGKIQRIMFDKLRLSEIFSRGFAHPAAQKFPMQIKMSIGTINNVWIQDYTTSYGTDDTAVLENVGFEAESYSSK